MSKKIKIYGERNTNTNYMQKLIKLNLDTEQLEGTVPIHIVKLQKILPSKELIKDIYFSYSYHKNLGWKHTKVKDISRLRRYTLVKEGVAIVSITKNPYSWLLSLFKKPYHQYYDSKLDFETFLQTPWKCIGRDNISHILKNPIELWNIKNASYLKLLELNALLITTESMFKSPSDVIKKIATHFEIRRYSHQFIDYEQSTKDSTKNSSYYRDYYLNELYLNEISPEAIKIINKTVDKKLMEYFDYEVIEA